jgi:hypothetical protein
MWPASPFGAPFFVLYGKKGREVHQEQSVKYVYAVSTDDFWKDGDSLFLGRVLRRALPQLDASHWEARIRTALGALG